MNGDDAQRQAWRVGIIGGLFTLGVLLFGVGLVWQLAGGQQGAAAGSEPASGHTSGGETAAQVAGLATTSGQARALTVLHEWDARRSAAWAAGDPAALRALYTDDSRSGARDARRLERWVDRGYVVTGLRTQVLSVEVVDERAGLLVLRVTDRIVGGVATGQGRDVPLPRDGATRWRMTLVRDGDDWLVREARRQAG